MGCSIHKCAVAVDAECVTDQFGEQVVLCGGASALVDVLRPGVDLQTLSRINAWLLANGRSIDEINAVRKHLDGLKGGGLARRARASKIVGLVISDAPIDGTLRTVVVISLVVGVGVVVLAVVLGSEKRTEQAGRLIAPIWARVLRLLRKPEPADLPAQMVAARASAVQTLHDRWLVATWGTVLAAATKFALLLMALRFVGVDDAEVARAGVVVDARRAVAPR